MISRIDLAIPLENGLETLRAAIVELLNLLTGEAVEKAGAKREQVYAVTVAGNTTMRHLFLGSTRIHD